METKDKFWIIEAIRKEQKKTKKLYEKSLKNESEDSYNSDYLLGRYYSFEWIITLIEYYE
jgi:hypothetical protein